MGKEYIEKINNFIIKLSDALSMKKLPFKFIVDDPAGNSFVENPFAPHTDPYAKTLFYERTKEVQEGMGYGREHQEAEETEETEETNESHPNSITLNSSEKQTSNLNSNLNTKQNLKLIAKTNSLIDESEKIMLNPQYSQNKRQFEVYKSSSQISSHLVDFTKSIETSSTLRDEALKFPTNCFCCYKPGEAYMCICTIPYFKEIIISCFKCQECGYKTTDVKGGGGISDKATKLTLTVKSAEDLNRDLFKSETSSIKIPEIDFETDTGSMGGMFTTVEGVLEKISSTISEMPFSQGDSNDGNHLDAFCKNIKNLLKLEKPFTLIIDDPLSNSFIFSPFGPEHDACLVMEEYERTWEQNEELGINDMKVENYAEEEEENANMDGEEKEVEKEEN
jgi:zinc finger protein